MVGTAAGEGPAVCASGYAGADSVQRSATRSGVAERPTRAHTRDIARRADGGDRALRWTAASGACGRHPARATLAPDTRPTEGTAMPKYLFEASYTQQGVEGIRSKGGSSRRDAIAGMAQAL